MYTLVIASEVNTFHNTNVNANVISQYIIDLKDKMYANPAIDNGSKNATIWRFSIQ